MNDATEQTVVIAAITGEGWMAQATGARQRPTRAEVARLAYDRYEVNGRKDGNDIEDWLLAEQELVHHYAEVSPTPGGGSTQPPLRGCLMTECEQSIVVQAPRDTIFDVLMDVSNLPRLAAIVEDTAAESGDRVRIQGYIQGRHYVADGYVRVVDVLRRLEWGFGGEGSCLGWIEVDGDDDAPSAQVTAHVSVAPGLMDTVFGDDQAATVGDMLAASLGALRRLVDGRTANDGSGN